MSKNTRCFREISQKKYIKIDFIIVRNNAGTQILPLRKKVIVFHNSNIAQIDNYDMVNKLK